MTKDTMIDVLKSDLCIVYFTKLNGQDRRMECTLKPEYLPPGFPDGFPDPDKSTETITVWDIEANDWRSFRWGSVWEMYAGNDLIIPEPIFISEEEAEELELEVAA